MVTGLYAAILGIWLVLLSFRVIALRGNPMMAILAFGNDGEETLDRAVRAHGNLIEYAPLMLILLLLLEQQGASVAMLHALGGSFLLGRLMHGFCFAFMKRSMPLRVGGMVLTLNAVLAASLLLLF